jgi:16S rRNA (guanine966-N2)-methyltransferase
MGLRILSGSFKGRILKSPKTLATRPTQGVVRQAVFNICQQSIEGSRFLDLFAGSGAMGLEAISRGAKSATFVEQASAATRCIRENIELLQVANQCELLPMDIFRAIKQLKQKKSLFDFIYIDPPYDETAKIAKDLLRELEGLIAPQGVIFLEDSSQDEQILEVPAFVRQKDTRRFGIARLYQFEYVQVL